MHADRSIQEDRGRYGSIASGADQHSEICQLDRLASMPGLTMRGIFSATLMEVIVQGGQRENCLGLLAMLHRTGTADIDRGIIFLLASAPYCLSRFAYMGWRIKGISVAG